MAICPSAGLLSLRQNLASATAQTGVRSSRHEQGGSDREIPTLGAFREQYAQAIHGQLGIWNMVQLIALCWFLNNLIVWMKRKATKNRDAKSRTSVSTKETAKGRATALTKARPSLIDAELNDPGLLKKHSSFRSYTTSFGTYPAIRVFKREHPQAHKLPSKPTPLPILVFVHGLGGSLAQFHPLLTSLVNVAPCLGIDLPGCGLSSFSPTGWDAYSQRALVELLAMVITDNCRGDTDQGIVLIGHSMGCGLCALLASKDSPLKSTHIEILGLVAICPKAISPTDQQLTLFRRFLRLPTPMLDVWRYWDRRGGPESASVARFVGPGADIETKKLQEKFNTQSKSGVWRRMAWGLACDDRKADLTTWAQLLVPIFLIGGESDKITKPNEVSAIANVLCRVQRPSPGNHSASNSVSDHEAVGTRDGAAEMKESPNMSASEGAESNTETSFLGDHHEAPNKTAESLPTFSKKRQVLKTTILPAPASHSLLYDPTTYRTLAGLIQKFLCDHIDSRLSLGWQLQHLSTEGKWDVKNLAKWQAVRPVSEPIAGIFRAMKTLREVDEEHCPEMFVRKWKGKLKAVIDISHENPVYDPRGLENGGIEYHKFPTVSKIPPTADEVQDFIKLVDMIRRTESSAASTDALVGVHCHYGFNRTGFFICSYLIEKERYGVQQAIDEFRTQRPPGIRHDHFLDTLFVRYCVGLKRAPTL